MADRRAAPAAEPVALAAVVATLETLDLAQLRVQFRNRTGRIAPARISRPLPLRVLAYRVQADAQGDLRPDTRRLLARIADSCTGTDAHAPGSDDADGASGQWSADDARPSSPAPRPAPPRGTVLVREWRGTMERVSERGLQLARPHLPEPVGRGAGHHRNQVERPPLLRPRPARRQSRRAAVRARPPPAGTPAAPGQLRCAIYTRVSSDQGLDQAFNSLDAQREAAQAYA